MRILVVDALYSENIAKFYADRAEWQTMPYAQQLAEITKESGVCAAWWLVNELNRMQDTAPIAVIANADPLQKSWAKENGFEINEYNWFHEILLEQIRTFQPDVLVVFPTTLLRPGFIKEVRMVFPRLQCAVAWDGVGAHSEVLVEEYDVILSCLDHTTSYYRRRGKRAATLITGFDTGIADELRASTLQYNTVFIGSMSMAPYYVDRFRLLLEISRQREISLWMSNYPDWQPWSRPQLGLLRRFQWRRFCEIWELGKRNCGARFGRDMFSALGQARICLNQHADFGGGHSAGNRRLWEATGMGTCLLTDWQPNLHEIFKIDEEVVTYRSTYECIEKMDYLLAHEDKRKAIAEAGMKRTHRDYSTRQFADALIRQVTTALKEVNLSRCECY